MSWVSLCEIGELQEGRGKYVEIEGYQLAVFLSGQQVYAIDNLCPHAGGSLWEGELEDGCVVCPWHQWTFRLNNGELRDAPGVMISSYPTRMFVREGQPTLVQADLPKF